MICLNNEIASYNFRILFYFNKNVKKNFENNIKLRVENKITSTKI